MRADGYVSVRWCLFAVTLMLATLALAGVASADGRSLLTSSVPGAFGIRYLPDRAVMTYTVNAPEGEDEQATFDLRVHLPEPLKWMYIDRERTPARACTWLAEDGQVAMSLPYGSHRLHLGWAGSGAMPPENATIPVTLDGRRIGVLNARFSLAGMYARGAVSLPAGVATLSLKIRDGVAPEEVSLSAAGVTVDRWRQVRGGLVSREPLLLPVDASLSLRVDHYGLDASPVVAVALENHSKPAPVAKVDDTIAEDAILVEAEAYTDGGGSPVMVTPGSHHDEHGGASVYTFKGDGSWLEWEFDVPEAGQYNLFARISCGSEQAFRMITVDDTTPDGLGLVQFPGTGGWGHADGEWWLVQVTGAEGTAAPLDLDAGAHRIRFTGVLEAHLNVDYLLLAPHR